MLPQLAPTAFATAVPNGDDCAVLPDGNGHLLLAIEGLVQDFVEQQPWFAGYSAVMVNLSDIAAMGGRALAVVDGQVQLEHASTSTTLKLTSAATGEVTKLALGPREAGSVAFSVDPQKLGLAPGKYGVEVETSSGEKPKVEVGGKVSHVRVSESGPVLEVEGAGSVPFYNIVEFGSAAA